jgi:hypothetical protein
MARLCGASAHEHAAHRRKVQPSDPRFVALPGHDRRLRAYTRPWTAAWEARWWAGTELDEYICQENNKYLQTLKDDFGKPILGPN